MGELSPQRQRALCEAMLRYQVGIDPHHLGAVVDLAAVGIVLHVWRNSPIEDWHAGTTPLHDGDMLRINAHTTWRVRQLLRRWRADMQLPPDAPASLLDVVDPSLTELLFIRVFKWMVKPTRRLPTGQTLAELAATNRGDLAEFEDHADRTLGAYCAVAEEDGALACLWRAAAAGGCACRHWWGTPTWPDLVNRFLHVLDQPDHDHWGSGGTYRSRLPTEPTQIADRVGLRRTLLHRPWELDYNAAAWMIDAGIGFLTDPLPQLPDHVTQELNTDDQPPTATM